MKLIRNLYLTNRFYLVLALLTCAMMASYAFPNLMPIVQTGIVILALVVGIDILLLFNKRVDVEVTRDTQGVLSLGDPNPVRLVLKNKARMNLHVLVIDELPEQFQERDFSISLYMPANKVHVQIYELRPLSRGEYHFGKINLYLSSGVGLI